MNFEWYTNKRAVVTGGAGFIGSHLAEKLVNLGAHVTVIDVDKPRFEANVQTVKDQITFMHHSITDPSIVDACHGADIIFHLAAFVSVPHSIIEPVRCHDSNVNGTLALLEAARTNGIKRFVFSSSSAVYGTQNGVCHESLACRPESPYGLSKYIGELYCQQYTRLFDIATVCLRYFNVYGPRQNPDGPYAAVVAKFKNQMKAHKPITIYGDGSQTRDFIPVETVVHANLCLGLLPRDHMRGQAVNVATGHSKTLLDVLNQLKKQFPDYREAVQFKPARNGDIQHSRADCDRLNTLIAMAHLDNNHSMHSQ